MEPHLFNCGQSEQKGVAEPVQWPLYVPANDVCDIRLMGRFAKVGGIAIAIALPAQGFNGRCSFDLVNGVLSWMSKRDSEAATACASGFPTIQMGQMGGLFGWYCMRRCSRPPPGEVVWTRYIINRKSAGWMFDVLFTRCRDGSPAPDAFICSADGGGGRGGGVAATGG